MSRFFSGTWRNQVDDVSAICRVSKTRSDVELLKDLKAINLKSDTGTCAVMIELIEDKLKPALGNQQKNTANKDIEDDWVVMDPSKK